MLHKVKSQVVPSPKAALQVTHTELTSYLYFSWAVHIEFVVITDMLRLLIYILLSSYPVAGMLRLNIALHNVFKFYNKKKAQNETHMYYLTAPVCLCIKGLNIIVFLWHV